MNGLPTITVAPATYGGWLATCDHCPDWRVRSTGRRAVDEQAVEHRRTCGMRRRD